VTGAPLIEIRGLVKSYQSLRPLRIADLSIEPSQRLVLRGFDAGAAEMFVHLVTGAALPDDGAVRVGGRDTREIATDTEWLASLDRFGIVTHRAVLLEGLSVAANLALPMTLSIDPMSDDVRAEVAGVASDVGLDAAGLDRPAGELDEEGRLRLHLARALATRPGMVMLEHPTSRLTDRDASSRLGRTLQALSTSRAFGWIALTEDAVFAEAAGGMVLTLDPASGGLRPAIAGWRRWIS